MILLKGVYWLADPLAAKEGISEKMIPSMKPGRNVKEKYYWIAIDALKNNFPYSNEKIAVETADIHIKAGKYLIIATHPRPYEYWIYDCLKSDIVILYRKSEQKKAESLFMRLKLANSRRKNELVKYLARIKPLLKNIARKGLIEGAIGRGSYFDINGYPFATDNINILLLSTEKLGKEEYENRINDIKNIIRASRAHISATFTFINPDLIKKDGKPIYDFIFINPNTRGLGLFYDKYVLGTSTAITESEKTQRIVSKLLQYLPNHDLRPELVKKAQLNLLPKTHK
ncbi:MAG: hypothetical protein ACP5JN_03340 [Candidatus Micrarchaeia archaeon]